MSEPHKVSKPKNYLFLVMDGRAHTDINEACVIEVIEEANYERAWNYFHESYEEMEYDYALVVAKETEPGKLTMLSVVYSLKELLATVGELS